MRLKYIIIKLSLSLLIVNTTDQWDDWYKVETHNVREYDNGEFLNKRIAISFNRVKISGYKLHIKGSEDEHNRSTIVNK
jgi:hypothetical protein